MSYAYPGQCSVGANSCFLLGSLFPSTLPNILGVLRFPGLLCRNRCYPWPNISTNVSSSSLFGSFLILGSFLTYKWFWLLGWKLRGPSVRLQHLPVVSMTLLTPSCIWTQTVISLPAPSLPQIQSHILETLNVVSWKVKQPKSCPPLGDYCLLLLDVQCIENCLLACLHSSCCRKLTKFHSCYYTCVRSRTFTCCMHFSKLSHSKWQLSSNPGWTGVSSYMVKRSALYIISVGLFISSLKAGHSSV